MTSRPDPIELARKVLAMEPVDYAAGHDVARALLVRDRQLRELREAAVRQFSEWMHFHEVAMADPFKAEAEALAFVKRIAALAASDPDKTGPAASARLNDDHPRSGPPAAQHETGASGGASTTRAASDPDSERGGA